MTPQELEFAERRMHQKWYDLVMAEQQGASLPVLEHMYNSYILAVEVYNRCSETYQRDKQVQQPDPVPVPPKQRARRTTSQPTSRPGGRKKKAS
jgi:hypothetical protein